MDSLGQRIESHIERVPFSGCWIWLANIRNGYGRTITGSRTDGSRRLASVHRLLYEKKYGPIETGMEIDHLCRVRCCVNPEHLESVTPKVNRLRGVGFYAQNARKTHCAKGHPYDEENTIVKNNGHRLCYACRKQNWLNAYQRKMGRL